MMDKYVGRLAGPSLRSTVVVVGQAPVAAATGLAVPSVPTCGTRGLYDSDSGSWALSGPSRIVNRAQLGWVVPGGITQ